MSEPTTKGSRPRLVIVESPAKAKTISGYLGRDYVVESSIGHIRDLPGSAAEMPAEQKHLWKTYAIDVENDFEPVYVVNKDKKQQVTRLRKALKDADELLLATDEENYHRYMRYLKGCQYYFIDESIDVSLVTYLKPGAAA